MRGCEQSRSPILSRKFGYRGNGIVSSCITTSLLGNAGQGEPMMPENLDNGMTLI